MRSVIMENIDPSVDTDLNDFKVPKKKGQSKESRFKEPSSEKEMEKIVKGFVPANTLKNTGWAYNVFLQWKAERNSNLKEREKVPDDLIDNPDAVKVNYWLCRLVDEIRKKDGTQYPPRSIHLILAGLQRKMLD